MIKTLQIAIATFALITTSSSTAQPAVNWYEFFAVADAGASVCATDNNYSVEYYRLAIYASYLGKENADDLLIGEEATRNVMKEDLAGMDEYRSSYKEAESFLNGLSEGELQKVCQSFTTPQNLPGYMGRSKE